MEILVGKTAGFCYGVKRAIDGAKSEIKKSKDPIYCLGEIVHNKQVVEELENEGITFIEDIKNAKGNTIIMERIANQPVARMLRNVLFAFMPMPSSFDKEDLFSAISVFLLLKGSIQY